MSTHAELLGHWRHHKTFWLRGHQKHEFTFNKSWRGQSDHHSIPHVCLIMPRHRTKEIHFTSWESLTFYFTAVTQTSTCLTILFTGLFKALMRAFQPPRSITPLKAFLASRLHFLVVSSIQSKYQEVNSVYFFFCCCYICILLPPLFFFVHTVEAMLIWIMERSVQCIWHGTVHCFSWKCFLLADLNPLPVAESEFSCDRDEEEKKKKAVAGQLLSSCCHQM